MVGVFISELLNEARLAALRRLGLLDTPAEAAFDRLGALATQVVNVPIALVTLVDDTRQFFKSCIGLPEPWATWRETPLSHSFCQHLLKSGEPLMIEDARTHPFFRDNLAIRDLGVIAYLGVPLKLETGEILGSFCVIDTQPRAWTREELQILRSLARSVITEIELRREVLSRQAALQEVEALNRELNAKAIALENIKSELETFTQSVSHDLQAPLRSIQSFSKLLFDRCSAHLPPNCLEFATLLSTSSTRMQTLLDGLETLSGVSKTPLRPTEVNLSEMAKGIFAELQASGPERRIKTKVEEGLVVSGDARLMQVALENLLRNAWKFTTTTPKPTIEVGSKEISKELAIYVRDDGVGFDMKAASKLFGAFQRLNTDFAGTGLGLATVKRIIERHHGRIWAEAEPGKGATFYFVIPRQEHARN